MGFAKRGEMSDCLRGGGVGVPARVGQLKPNVEDSVVVGELAA